MVQRDSLLIGVALSLVLHGLLLAWLEVRTSRLPQRESGTTAIRVDLLPPYLSEAAVPERTESGAEPDKLSMSQRESASDPERSAGGLETSPGPLPSQATVSQPVESQLELPEMRTGSAVEAIPESPSPLPLVPNTLAVRQAVQDATTIGDANVVPHNCTARQARNKLLDCSTVTGLSEDLQPLERWAFSFATPAEVTRSRRTVGTLADNRQQLMAGLNAANLDEDSQQSLSQQIDAGIEVYTGSGNTPLRRLQDQAYRNDAAYQQAQRVLNPR